MSKHHHTAHSRHHAAATSVHIEVAPHPVAPSNEAPAQTVHEGHPGGKVAHRATAHATGGHKAR